MTIPFFPVERLYNPDTSILAGMTPDQLRAALASAQSALIQLQTGGKPVSVSYAQGDGSRSVTYTQASIAGLTALIMQLQRQLGIGRRRALRPIF
ncbi:phage head-tail adapter protein [Acetobacter musti]|uniref:Phage head-tail adapter protein n=1 Tax=Acetobacter musti TaxID=864732 RepID=A0ABX0JJ38_9PROT|nr:gpW family head-tail joining protein [Acetobacter musti]NHN83656.1 phage head-tail adapter protein [Acetobacter musti]